jgi:hypothetical protein
MSGCRLRAARYGGRKAGRYLCDYSTSPAGGGPSIGSSMAKASHQKGDLLDLAVEKRIVEKTGAWFAYIASETVTRERQAVPEAPRSVRRSRIACGAVSDWCERPKWPRCSGVVQHGRRRRVASIGPCCVLEPLAISFPPRL